MDGMGNIIRNKRHDIIIHTWNSPMNRTLKALIWISSVSWQYAWNHPGEDKTAQMSKKTPTYDLIKYPRPSTLNHLLISGNQFCILDYLKYVPDISLNFLRMWNWSIPLGPTYSRIVPSVSKKTTTKPRWWRRPCRNKTWGFPRKIPGDWIIKGSWWLPSLNLTNPLKIGHPKRNRWYSN